MLLTVPSPTVEVTRTPTSGPFYAGCTLSLRCAVTVDASVDTPYVVSVMWLRSGVSIGNSDRIPISNVTQLSSYSYTARLGFNPLSSTEDTGTYTCQVVISPASVFVQQVTQSGTERITVQGRVM